MNGAADSFTVVIPVYQNEANLPRLLAELEDLSLKMPRDFSVVFVVDGSPDRCHEILSAKLPAARFDSQLLQLSRNFGSFSAVMAGMSAATGEHCGVMAADLQEPPELMIEFHRILSSGEADVCFGVRTGRSDPWLTELTSNLFWWVYRRFVVKEMPPGGVDVFACTRAVREHVSRFSERHFGTDVRDRYGFDQFENRGQPSDAIDCFMDDESDGSRASELQYNRIHIRHVIWHQQET